MKRFDSTSILVLLALAGCAHAAAPAPIEPTPPPPVVSAEPVVEPTPEPVEPPPPPMPIDVPVARPCEVVVTASTPPSTEACVELERVQPESIPLSVCPQNPGTQTFRFDDQGRILEGPGSRYAYRANGTATRTVGRQRTTLRFDAQHNITQLGSATRTFDLLGRLLRSESGRHHLQYVYAPDGTYTTEHDYPDADEFCVADLVEVGRDATGHVAFDRYDHCGINEVPRTIRYQYDETGLVIGAEIDVQSDGTIDATVTFRYSC